MSREEESARSASKGDPAGESNPDAQIKVEDQPQSTSPVKNGEEEAAARITSPMKGQEEPKKEECTSPVTRSKTRSASSRDEEVEVVEVSPRGEKNKREARDSIEDEAQEKGRSKRRR